MNLNNGNVNIFMVLSCAIVTRIFILLTKPSILSGAFKDQGRIERNEDEGTKGEGGVELEKQQCAAGRP